MIFYFSGVGNSAWVARKLADKLQDKVLPIAEEIRTPMEYALAPGERVGFVYPVYADRFSLYMYTELITDEGKNKIF